MYEHEKKESFSYISPELKRKRGLQLLSIELGILSLATLIIIGLLFYIGVLHIPAFNTPLSGTFPTGNSRVTVASDNPRYKVKLNNPELLEKILKNWGVLGGRMKNNIWGATKGNVIEHVNIIMTDKEQILFQYVDEKGRQYSSSNIEISGSSVTIRSFIGEQALTPLKGKDEAKIWGGILTANSLRTLYHLVNLPDSQKKLNDNEKMFSANLLQWKSEIINKPIFLVEKL